YKSLENEETISINRLKYLQSNINDLKHFIEFYKIKATCDKLVFSDLEESSTDHITEKQYLLTCHLDYETQSGKLPSFDNFWFLWIVPKYNAISYTTFTVAYFIRAQESEASFLERDHLLKYLLRKIVTTIRYRNNILKESFNSIADKLYQIWIKTKHDISENMERDQNDTIIAPFQESNESFPGMTLPVAMYGPPSETTIPQPPSNIPLYETSFFDNTNELERGGTPSRIPRRVTFNTSNDRRSPFPVRVENVQQLVASILSSNQSSRPSNLRVTTPSVGNTNSGSSLGNPYNFSQATQYSLNNCWLESNSSNRRNNTMGHQNVTTKGIPQSTTSVSSSQPSNNINIFQPILIPQPAIVPVGENNDNAYLQVILGLAELLQGQQIRE
ncbi:6399_t:CDS:2, partial [Funneliformis caledonium]